jgi:DNA-binding response OmpR family regulator
MTKKIRKILIIEEDVLLGIDIKRALEKVDFTVERKVSLDQAKESLSNQNPDLVIANTSITNNPIFYKINIYLKKLQTPFIWISSLAKHEISVVHNYVNVIGTFFKPFNSKELVDFIINFFKGKKA